MRRDSSTVVAVVGEVSDGLLADAGRSLNVSVAWPPAGEEDVVEAGARALRKASGSASPYVLVPADPLAAVAAEWRAMWDVTQGPRGAAAFEERAREVLAAWRARRFELPDYYLVLARAVADDAGQDMYLGPLRAARPSRVAVAALTDDPGQADRLLGALRSLPYGLWWPPLDELLDVARRFYAGSIAEGGGSLAGR